MRRMVKRFSIKKSPRLRQRVRKVRAMFGSGTGTVLAGVGGGLGWALGDHLYGGLRGFGKLAKRVVLKAR